MTDHLTAAEIAAVRAQAGLVDTIHRRGVKLTQRGREYTALCPFHVEKTPSFSSDGKHLVFMVDTTAAGSGEWELYSLPVQGGVVLPDTISPLTKLTFSWMVATRNASPMNAGVPQRSSSSRAWSPSSAAMPTSAGVQSAAAIANQSAQTAMLAWITPAPT